MKVIDVISNWAKPGSKYAYDALTSKDIESGTKQIPRVRTNANDMAQCIVQLPNGQKVTRHINLNGN